MNKRKSEFIITKHAVERWHDKFSDYTLDIPMWKALELAEPADFDLECKLEIQSINKTADPRRIDSKTYYFLYKKAVFVCHRIGVNEYVVVTCWPLEAQAPPGSTRNKLKVPKPLQRDYIGYDPYQKVYKDIEEYINSDKEFNINIIIDFFKGYPKNDILKAIKNLKSYNDIINKEIFIDLWENSFKSKIKVKNL
jgi:hypothetical protein